MLIHLKGILAIIKHRMNKKTSGEEEDKLSKLCLICEKQISMITHLLSLRLDQTKEEESRFDVILEYAELWSKNKRGRATPYEKKKAESMSAEMDSLSEKAMTVARDAEIEVSLQGLKALAIEFGIAGQALGTS